MKRTFRVATVFTGAAACAATLTPAAQAAPVAPGVMTRATPDAIASDCGRSPTASVHLYYTISEKHSVPACVDSLGVAHLGKRFGSYCGGAWSGYLYVGGSARHFTAGTAYHNMFGVSVSKIDVTKFNPKYQSAMCVGFGP